LRFYGSPVSLPRQECLLAGTFHAIEDFSIDIGSLLGPVQRTLALLAIGAGGRTRIFSTGLPQYGDVATARRGRGADTAKPRYRPESHRGYLDPLAGHDLGNSPWRRRAKLNEERGY